LSLFRASVCRQIVILRRIFIRIILLNELSIGRGLLGFLPIVFALVMRALSFFISDDFRDCGAQFSTVHATAAAVRGISRAGSRALKVAKGVASAAAMNIMRTLLICISRLILAGTWQQTPALFWVSSARTRSKRRFNLGWAALIAAAGAHGLVFMILSQSAAAPSPKPITAALVVSLMMPIAESLPASPPEPKPKPEPIKQTPKPARVTQPSVREIVSESAVAPELTQAVAQKTVEAEAQPVVAARFDADYLNNPAPKYPPLARRFKEQGVVLVRVHVLPSGDPDEIELKRSSGSERLDQAALTVVKQWRFVPAKQGSDAVAAWVVVPISFSLGA